MHDFVTRIGADTGRREAFLERWSKRFQGGGSLLYDATSVSSHSPSLELAEWGYNRVDEQLPQINFSLAAAPAGMPLFYRVTPSSIPAVRTFSFLPVLRSNTPSAFIRPLLQHAPFQQGEGCKTVRL